MRYWRIGGHTLGSSADDVDLGAVVDDAVELSRDEFDAARRELADVVAVRPPVSTVLAGNGHRYVTDVSALRVTVHVVAPVDGPTRARPLVNGAPVAAGVFTFEQPGSVTVETRAGNNDVVIVEEF